MTEMDVGSQMDIMAAEATVLSSEAQIALTKWKSATMKGADNAIIQEARLLYSTKIELWMDKQEQLWQLIHSVRNRPT